jgi:glycosyltransferase involved in cell wall biosynthesis
MNILQLISSSRTSGAEKHVMVLSENLQKLGHRVIAACPPGDWLPQRLNAAGIETVTPKMHGLLSARAVFELREIARMHNIDVIHTHLTRATYMGFFLGRMLRVPVISTMHVATRDFAYRYMPKRAMHYVTVSDYLRGLLIQRGADPSHLHTVHNGTDILQTWRPTGSGSLTVRAEMGLPADALLVGMVARVDAFKGQHLLVQAARQIVDAAPRAHFLFVGHAEEQIQQSLWEAACASGVEDRLRFAGVRNDVPRLLEAMDVVALPSVTEACSMAIIEAMSMGKPVVATRAGGNPELLEDGQSGLLVGRNSDELAAAIASLLTDHTRRVEMGSAAQQRASTRFTAEAMARRLEALYAQVVGRVLPEGA